jgi:hypothetical protein
MRDVIQFKNHSLSAWAEISFFIPENTSPRFFVGHLVRALIHVVLAESLVMNPLRRFSVEIWTLGRIAGNGYRCGLIVT